VKNRKKQTPDALEKALQSSINGTKHAIKLISKFVTAVLQVRTSNLVKVANAIESRLNQIQFIGKFKDF